MTVFGMFRRLVLVVAFVLLVMILGIRGYLSVAAPLPRPTLAHTACDRPCWLGILPGETPIDAVPGILAANGVTMTRAEGVSEGGRVFFQGDDFSGMIQPVSGTVRDVLITVGECPLPFMVEMGLPFQADYWGLEHYLLYPAHPTYIYVAIGNQGTVYTVVFTTPNVTEDLTDGGTLPFSRRKATTQLLQTCD